jgi:16S rRNA (guanine527-N7)-methyltransferase
VAELCARVAADRVAIPPERAQRLIAHLIDVSRWSARVNLVSRRELPALVEKHLAPSLAPLLSDLCRRREIDGGFRLLDVGSGGGFPGVVLAIVRPAWMVVLLEPRERKARFLASAGRDLTNVRVRRVRVEALAEDREDLAGYDLITARAVAPPEEIWPKVRSLLARDGEAHVYTRRDEVRVHADRAARRFDDVRVLDPIEPPWCAGAICRLARRS